MCLKQLEHRCQKMNSNFKRRIHGDYFQIKVRFWKLLNPDTHNDCDLLYFTSQETGNKLKKMLPT